MNTYVIISTVEQFPGAEPTIKSTTRDSELAALQAILYLMQAGHAFQRVFMIDEFGNVLHLDFTIADGKPILTLRDEVETIQDAFGSESVVDVVRSVRVDRASGTWVLTKGQWSALVGWITKWRKAAKFWEQEAKKCGSQAVYKIR